MSELDELRAEMAAEVLDAFGVSADYTFLDSSTQTITVRYDDDVETTTKDGEFMVVSHVVGLRHTDLVPKMGESITIDSVTRKIGRQLKRDGGLYRYELT